jgi:hypothetical protein
MQKLFNALSDQCCSFSLSVLKKSYTSHSISIAKNKNSNQTVTNLPLYNTKVISTLEWHDT